MLGQNEKQQDGEKYGKRKREGREWEEMQEQEELILAVGWRRESRSGKSGEKLLSIAKTGNHSCCAHIHMHTHSCWRSILSFNSECP